MKFRNLGRRRDDDTALQMTAMIDIVFLLLIFFIMTFKIVMPEGDFRVKMPRALAGGPSPLPDIPPVIVKLGADGDGHCNRIRLGDSPLDGFDDLSLQMRGIVDDLGGYGSSDVKQIEVEFDCDYNLRYEYVIKAITAVSGEVRDGKVIRVVEKIKFTPPNRAPPSE